MKDVRNKEELILRYSQSMNIAKKLIYVNPLCCE